MPGVVRGIGAAAGVPTALVAGSIEAGSIEAGSIETGSIETDPAGYVAAVSLTDLVGRVASFADPAGALHAASAHLAAAQTWDR